jgi:hypothetical protein
VPWQRCQFHLQQNAQAYVTKMSRRREVAESIRAILNAENAQEAERLLKLIAAKYEKDMRAPQAHKTTVKGRIVELCKAIEKMVVGPPKLVIRNELQTTSSGCY